MITLISSPKEVVSLGSLSIASVQFSCSVVSDSATPWTAAHQASLSITNSRSWLKLMSSELVMPSSHLMLCHPLSCLQSFPASGSFQMNQFFASDSQSIEVSASAAVLPVNIQDLLPLGWTGWTSLLSKGLSVNTLFQQHKRRLDIWTSTDGQYQNKIDCIRCSQRWRSSIQSAKIRLGADCGSDHELLIAKFRLKLKKVGKTTNPFRYDLIKFLTIIQCKWQIDSGD